MPFDVPGYRWHFKIAPPPQWFDFVQRNPEQDLKPVKACEWTPQQECDVRMMFDALTPFKGKYIPDLSDYWKLQLPGDCEDFALSLRAMIQATKIMGRESMQPAIVNMQRGQHFVLIVPTLDRGVFVFDPILKQGPIKFDSMKARLTCLTDGEEWHIMQPESEGVGNVKAYSEVKDHADGDHSSAD